MSDKKHISEDSIRRLMNLGLYKFVERRVDALAVPRGAMQVYRYLWLVDRSVKFKSKIIAQVAVMENNGEWALIEGVDEAMKAHGDLMGLAYHKKALDLVKLIALAGAVGWLDHEKVK